MKLAVHILSMIFLGCFVLSCSRPVSDPREALLTHVQGERQYRSLRENHGVIAIPGWQVFAENLHRRLGRDIQPKPDLIIEILEVQDRVALSLPPGRILLSRPLVLSFSEEGELAFVVAHEMAHLVLDHFEVRDLSPEQAQQRELDADRYAVELLRVAGYDPSVAEQAILRAYSHQTTGAPTAPTHPEVSARRAALHAQIKRAERIGIGGIYSPEFGRLQRSLRDGRYTILTQYRGPGNL